jgi:hypothetical protein
MIGDVGITYAVTWEEPDGSARSGRLELAARALTLEGRNSGLPVAHAFPYGEVRAFRVANRNGERLQSRPTLILELRAGGRLRIAGLIQQGIVSELASRLGQERLDGFGDHELLTS